MSEWEPISDTGLKTIRGHAALNRPGQLTSMTVGELRMLLAKLKEAEDD